MWKYSIPKSVRGSAHQINGLPCQDASDYALVGDILICVLSDGAGSAKHSDCGSQIIVEESLKFFREYFAKVESPQIVMRDLGIQQGQWLIESIRERIARAAIDKGEPEHEFAATLLVAVLSKHRTVFYQVGDGVWCACKSGVLGAVTWPEQGEFVGQTMFVTSSTALKSLQCLAVEGCVDFVVGMTDGLERLALNLQGRFPHSGFFEPLISALRHADSLTDFTAKLEVFLASPRVCERTDDDKSLALIVYEDGI
jgi:hypothetical protein